MSSKGPHSVEAEQSLLGALMLDSTTWARIAKLVDEADLYVAAHRLTFSAIAGLQDERRASDPVTVCDKLARREQLEAVGGREYIARLYEDTPSAASAEAYATRVRELATLRRLRALGAHVARTADSPGDRRPAELVAEASTKLLELQAHARVGRGLVEARELVGELLDDLDRRRAGERGLSLGLADLDELTNGLEGGDLLVVAGRPGMGKTALLVSIAAHVSQSTGVAVFSAEMPALQLMRRCVALLGKIPQGRLRHADQLDARDWESIDHATSALTRRRLWIDDTPSPAFAHVRAEVLSLRARGELGLVLIDYAQLLRGPGDNRYEQLRDIAYGCKNLAKETGLPVVLLAQLNRGVEARENKRPRLHDLRDSGAIEEAADIVGLLYSEGYYDAEHAMGYVLECHIAKNRNGERGECLWRFAGEHSRVELLEHGPREQYVRMRAQRKERADDL